MEVKFNNTMIGLTVCESSIKNHSMDCLGTGSKGLCAMDGITGLAGPSMCMGIVALL